MMSASGLVRAKRSLFKPKMAVYSPMLGNIVLRWRSCWMRSRLMMSASRMASSTSWVTRQPICSNTRGTSVDGPAEGHVRAQLGQRPDVRARHAAVEDVAEDGDVQPCDAAFLLADGERVEQRLGGMLVRAVAGVDDAGVEHARQEMRRAGGAVADDDDVGVERLEVARGVLERLALLERGGLGGEVDDVGREALSRPARSWCACGWTAR